MCSNASADGFPPPRKTRALSSISIKLDASSAPLSIPVEVIASRIGAREITALKFPLVPNTHPRS